MEFIGRPLVKWFALYYWTVVLSCLSLCNVGVLWPNGWIKIKLGVEVGLGPGHIVFAWDPKVAQPPIFGPYLLWPNAGWIKMLLGYIVLDEDPAAPPTTRHSPAPIFCPCLLWPNGWMDQDSTWYEGRPRPKTHCYMGTQLPPKGAQPQIFGPCLLWANGRPSQLLLSTCNEYFDDWCN